VHLLRASWRKLLPERWRRLTEEFAKFGTIGLINLFVNFAVFNLLWLTLLRNGELKAKAIATIVATTSAYFMNRHWTYRDRPKATLRREYTLFFIFNVVGLVIEVTVVGIAKYGFGQTHIVVLNLCTAIGIVLGTVFRFWAYRTHVFKLEILEPAPAAGPGRAARIRAARITAARIKAPRIRAAAPATMAARSNGAATVPTGAVPKANGSVRPANGSARAASGSVRPASGSVRPANGVVPKQAANGHRSETAALDGIIVLSDERASTHR
jgi:putative flippase GtrA